MNPELGHFALIPVLLLGVADVVFGLGRYGPQESRLEPRVSVDKNSFDPLAQFGQEILLNARMALQPGRVARRRMGQRNVCRGIVPPRPRSFSD